MRAFLGVVLLLLPFVAIAGSHRFEAEFVTAPPAARVIAAEMAWNCEGAACAASGTMSNSAARICSRLTREAGPVKAFAVNGAAFDAAALDKCNAKARVAA